MNSSAATIAGTIGLHELGLLSAQVPSKHAAYAARYIERFSFALVPLHGKAPYAGGWQEDRNLIRTVQAAGSHWSRNPHDNLGACLEPSGLVSLDADHIDGARIVLAAEGVDLDVLSVNTPTVIGRARRLEFRAPDVALSRKSLVWPARQPGEKPVTVLEFRAGRVQDVLPPSIHPDLQRPYHWLTPPRDGFPPLPDALLALWQDFEDFKHRARNLCPWAPPEPEPQPRAARPPYTGRSVIGAFNNAHDCVAILESHGYVRAGKRRWRSPDGHGMAGVVLLKDGKVFCHHSSDALGDGKPHDAFDLYAQFKHRGDLQAAVREAARLLGMDERSNPR